MISDRPYMRSVSPNSGLAPLFWLLGALAAVFVAQNLVEVWFSSRVVSEWFGLSARGLAEGRFWTLFTYGFLHDTRGIWHILANTLGLFFLGRIVLPELGARRFLLLFFVCTILGGLFWTGINFSRGGMLVGASGAVFGLITYFACMRPNERITVLLFFILPVTVIPKYAAMFIGGVQLFLFLFAELPGGGLSTGIAHSAHLGGMLAGLILYRVWSGESAVISPSKSVELPKWMRTKRANPDIGGSYRVNVSQGRDMKREVDRILDKINHSGFGSLTPEEKRTLDDARDTLGKR
ncbi:MAG TPA: rhomboid family intramembrane serine protease [Opitutaceae bacterium]|nr:rhomboid family intramembrane serine protease [Opitutaceae bacterium]